MDISPGKAVVDANKRYGMREKIAFSTLGTRPFDLLLEKDEAMSVNQISETLEEQRDENIPRWSVERYFKVLDEYDFIDYESGGDLFRAWNKSVQKNGTGYEEFEKFIDMYPEP